MLPSRIFPNPSLAHVLNITRLRLSGAELGSNQVSWTLHGLTNLRHLDITGFSFPFNAPGCAPRPAYRLVTARIAEWRAPKNWLDRYLSSYCIDWLLGDSRDTLAELEVAHCWDDVFPWVRETLLRLERAGVRLRKQNLKDNLQAVMSMATLPELGLLEVECGEVLERAPLAGDTGDNDQAKLRAALAGLPEACRAKVRLTYEGFELDVFQGRKPRP